VLAGLDTADDRRAFRALLRQLATHADALDPAASACDIAKHIS
jgi:hypothetical protein